MLSAILLLTSLHSLDAVARQIVEDSEKRHVEVNASAREQNRLAIEGRRIGTVVPSQKGALVYAKDEEAGALYFTFPDGQMGTVTLFVSDEQSPSVTYKLILVPRPIAGEEIVIKPSMAPAAGVARGGSDARATSYTRRIKDLILSMADEESKEGTRVDKEIPLWKEARLILLSRYVAGQFVGEKYRLTNVSEKDMQLVEQELYRRGVAAVSIENLTLAPGDSTLIFVVRGRKDNE